MDIASAYRLCEDDVPEASTSLTGKSVDLLTIVELKRWLACRGARRIVVHMDVALHLKLYWIKTLQIFFHRLCCVQNRIGT